MFTKDAAKQVRKSIIYMRVKQEQEKDKYRQFKQIPVALPPLKLHLLSLKRSAQHPCELCDTPGSLLCASCRVTYYCSNQHYDLDKDLHLTICQKLKLVRTPLPFGSDQDTRDRLKKQQKLYKQDLCGFSYWLGKVAMEAGNYNKAIPAATVAARYAREAFDDLEMVIPPLLVTSECYIHKNNIVMAESFLVKATSIENELPSVQCSISANIRRIEGLLFLAKGNLEEARFNFAEDIYQTSKVFGSTHIRTSPGYCYLGEVFRQLEDTETAASLLRSSVNMWVEFMVPIIQDIIEDMQNQARKVVVISEVKSFVEERDKFEGLKILKKAYSFMKLLPSTTGGYVDMANACYGMSAIHFAAYECHDAMKAVGEGLKICGEHGLKERAVYKRLLTISRYCGRRLSKERATTQTPRSQHHWQALEN